MTTNNLTLMVVHAHPDDEAISTGGILARYSDEGVRTVLVTCTNGELGDGPGGTKPGEPGHDEAVVVAERRRELEHSCAILGVSVLELLGFHDSGMDGWEQNKSPDAFCNIDVDKAAEPLITLIEHYQPQVLVTYDENGFYGHPDHIQANHITLYAASVSESVRKVYFTAVAKSHLRDFAARLQEAGIDAPFDPSATGFGTPDERVTTVIDCAPFAERKYEALAAHKSQAENVFFLKLERSLFSQIFSFEEFVRFIDHSGAPLPEADLFAGLR